MCAGGCRLVIDLINHATKGYVVNTHSDLGMPTTLGNFAFLGAKANDSAVIVDKVCRPLPCWCCLRLAADRRYLFKLLDKGPHHHWQNKP